MLNVYENYQGLENKDLTITLNKISNDQKSCSVSITDGKKTVEDEVLLVDMLQYGLNTKGKFKGKFTIGISDTQPESVPILSTSKLAKRLFKINPIPGYYYFYDGFDNRSRLFVGKISKDYYFYNEIYNDYFALNLRHITKIDNKKPYDNSILNDFSKLICNTLYIYKDFGSNIKVSSDQIKCIDIVNNTITTYYSEKTYFFTYYSKYYNLLSVHKNFKLSTEKPKDIEYLEIKPKDILTPEKRNRILDFLTTHST